MLTVALRILDHSCHVLVCRTDCSLWTASTDDHIGGSRRQTSSRCIAGWAAVCGEWSNAAMNDRRAAADMLRVEIGSRGVV